MNKTIHPKQVALQQFFLPSIVWVAIFLSATALIYHVRWFIPFLANKTAYVVPAGQEPFTWFLIQIGNNLVFLFAGYLLVQLFNRFRKTGFFDEKCVGVFKRIIACCLLLALMGVIKLASGSYNSIAVTGINAAGICRRVIVKTHAVAGKSIYRSIPRSISQQYCS